ncbi:expressed unknown protein [Seminavis robusta]|uniref:Uncharacterized protein n=1 Tax=Seminavis robusta TaxID=568900 RepID=A0A9N8HBL4_9STRA|nr:expressed unknown protein [Seminavis robusta]|eukprot:Sro265_g102890.1 n/a (224) ;mRNA; r:63933-64604
MSFVARGGLVLAAVLLLLRFVQVDGFIMGRIMSTRQDKVITKMPAVPTSLLGEETASRLRKDYRDLREAFHYQAQYFQQATRSQNELTEDCLEQAAYMAHLQRFQQEQAADVANRDHLHASSQLEKIRDEWERLHHDKIVQDFEMELAQAEEARAHDRAQCAFKLLGLVEKSEWDLKEALHELRLANNMDSACEAELRKHHAVLRSFKARLIDHDPFKGNVAF